MSSLSDAEKARAIADKMQAETMAKGGEFTDWFEELYARADGNSGMVPWGDQKPHPGLVSWMETTKHKAGAKAIDVGCGLGDNAAYLQANGYDVTAVDLSQSAIDWAARRFSSTGIDFRQVDLFDLPARSHWAVRAGARNLYASVFARCYTS